MHMKNMGTFSPDWAEKSVFKTCPIFFQTHSKDSRLQASCKMDSTPHTARDKCHTRRPRHRHLVPCSPYPIATVPLHATVSLVLSSFQVSETELRDGEWGGDGGKRRKRSTCL
jgi:hypothetical protein